MKIKRFSRATSKKLKHYVYALVDPTDKKIFYVGKGKGPSRPFTHLKRNTSHNNKKLQERISDMRSEGKEPEVEIIRYGLDKDSALDIESALIDAIGVEQLTNTIRGHGADFGRISALELNQQLGGKRLDVTDIRVSAILIYSHQSQKAGLNIYDATRGNWPVNKDTREEEEKDGKLKRRYAFAMHHSVILEIYEILKWFPGGTTVSSLEFDKEYHKGRAVWEFVGKKADKPELRRYRNRVLYKGDKRLEATQIGFRYLN